MSFNEKSIWASLAITVFAFGGYFLDVFQSLTDGSLTRESTLGMFIGVVVTVVVLQIGLHIVLTIANPKEADQPADERDKLFAQKSGNISGWILGVGVLTIAVHSVMDEMSSLLIAHLLLLAVVISHLADNVLQLFYYRRGY